MPFRSQTRAIQKAVNELGHDAGPNDGLFGPKTAAGVRSWLGAKGEPVVTPRPNSGLKRIVWHWSAGPYSWTDASAERYHFGVDGNGREYAGDHAPEDNIYVGDDDYAAHVGRFNTGAIGLSAMAMMGAKVSPSGDIQWGGYPLLDVQVDWLVSMTAELCQLYGIEVSRETTLSHAEVWETFGIWQQGRWDIRCLPGWSKIKTGVEVGDILRDRVQAALR